MHGSRITDALGKAIDGPFEKLLQVDEFGEIGQLVKLAVNATSAGLMKKHLKSGFGVTVGRETADLLSDIGTDITMAYTSSEINLSERWWSVFFDDNVFYKDLLSAELYTKDVLSLLEYITYSFHRNPSSVEEHSPLPLPPTNPYTAFYTIHSAQKGCSIGPCVDGYAALRNVPQSVLKRHYIATVVDSAGDAENAFDWAWNWRKGETRNILEAVFPNDKENVQRKDAVRRFRDAYRFLSDPVARKSYNAFVDRVGSLDGSAVGDSGYSSIEVPYEYTGTADAEWMKKGVRIPTPKPKTLNGRYSVPQGFDGLREFSLGGHSAINTGITFTFPENYTQFKNKFVIRDTTQCAVPKVERAVGAESYCFFYTHPKDNRGRCIRDQEVEIERRQCADPIASLQSFCSYEIDCGPGADTRDGSDEKSCRDTDFDRSYRDVRSFECPIVESHVVDPDHEEYYGRYTCGVYSRLIPAATERYCPAYQTLSAKGRLLRQLETFKKLRKIYDATLAAHTHLVGSADQYIGPSSRFGERISSYRNTILFNTSEDHSDRFDRWRVVRDATLKQFRDGSMTVYIPLNDGEFDLVDYFDVLSILSNRCFSEIKGLRSISGTDLEEGNYFIDPKYILSTGEGVYVRDYLKTNCDLGTIFQEQALFAVRRENADLSKPLTVYLACGYGFEGQCQQKNSTQESCVFALPVNESDGNVVRYEYTGCQPNARKTPRPISSQPDIISARFSPGANTCTVLLGEDRSGEDLNPYQIQKRRAGYYDVTLDPGEDVVLFPVPRPIDDLIDISSADGRSAGGSIRCTIDAANIASEYVADEDALTQVVTVSEHFQKVSDQSHTFEDIFRKHLSNFRVDAAVDGRAHRIGGALFYLYIWGWYTGYVQMPYYSIQGLLSSPPITIVGSSAEMADISRDNDESLMRYRILASLFADESDTDFDSKNFGFLTPQEARDTYIELYDKRFNSYFGRTLGEFLPLVPRQQY